MLDYIKNNFGNRPSFNAGERMELEFLRQSIPKLKEEVYGKGQAGDSTGESDKRNMSDSSDSEGEEFVEDLPQAKLNQNRGPRISVSAEVFGKFNKKEDFVAKVFPKNDD